MPNETTQKSFLEETFAELEQINEALKNHASSILHTDIKGEVQSAVAQALNEAKEDDEIEDTNPEVGDETGETGGETPEVPSDDTGAEPESDELSNDVTDELPPVDASPMDTDAEPPVDDVTPIEPEGGEEDVVDLTGASDEEVLQVFKKMGPEDEIEVVQTPDGNIELNIGGEEYFIKQNGGEHAEPDADNLPGSEMNDNDADNLPAEEGLVAEGDYKQEAARVKEMGQDKGNVDDSRRDDVKKSPEIGVAKVGEKSKIKNNKFENSDKRDDVKNPKEIGVAEIGKGGETIDQNVPDNFEHGMSDRRKDVSKPDEIGVAVVKAVPGNMSMEASNKPNYDRGTKSTPVDADPKVSEKTTVGIAENVEQLKAKLDENHDKLVYTRQKYAEAIAENAKLRNQIQTLNENVESFKQEEEGYKNAIMTLREQFNEVAVFTSNLTHAVKLMTEHATTKEEKNQILTRLDAAKTLTESKQIYESLAASLGKPAKKPVQIDEQLNRSATSGASVINESTAYKSPELDRMLDLIHKIK